MCLGGGPASCSVPPQLSLGLPPGQGRGRGRRRGGPGAERREREEIPPAHPLGWRGGGHPRPPPPPARPREWRCREGGDPRVPAVPPPSRPRDGNWGGPDPLRDLPLPIPDAYRGGDTRGLSPPSPRVPFASGRGALRCPPLHQHLPGGSRGVSPQCPPPQNFVACPPPPCTERARGPPRPAPGRGQRGLAGGAGKVAPVPALRPGGVTAGLRAATAPGSAPSLGSREGTGGALGMRPAAAGNKERGGSLRCRPPPPPPRVLCRQRGLVPALCAFTEGPPGRPRPAEVRACWRRRGAPGPMPEKGWGGGSRCEPPLGVPSCCGLGRGSRTLCGQLRLRCHH